MNFLTILLHSCGNLLASIAAFFVSSTSNLSMAPGVDARM